MKFHAHTYKIKHHGHSPRGGCGLKSDRVTGLYEKFNGHSPRGGCGLKLLCVNKRSLIYCHSPRGGCGLKLGIQDAVEDSMKVTLREEGVD